MEPHLLRTGPARPALFISVVAAAALYGCSPPRAVADLGADGGAWAVEDYTYSDADGNVLWQASDAGNMVFGARGQAARAWTVLPAPVEWGGETIWLPKHQAIDEIRYEDTTGLRLLAEWDDGREAEWMTSLGDDAITVHSSDVAGADVGAVREFTLRRQDEATTPLPSLGGDNAALPLTELWTYEDLSTETEQLWLLDHDAHEFAVFAADTLFRFSVEPDREGRRSGGQWDGSKLWSPQRYAQVYLVVDNGDIAELEPFPTSHDFVYSPPNGEAVLDFALLSSVLAMISVPEDHLLRLFSWPELQLLSETSVPRSSGVIEMVADSLLIPLEDGGSLLVDIADPTAPRPTAHLGGSVSNGIATEPTAAWLTSGERIYRFDLSTADEPEVTTSASDPGGGCPHRVGQTLFTANRIWSIEDMEHPVAVHTIEALECNSFSMLGTGEFGRAGRESFYGYAAGSWNP